MTACIDQVRDHGPDRFGAEAASVVSRVEIGMTTRAYPTRGLLSRSADMATDPDRVIAEYRVVAPM
jgi:hypothetical protein